MTTITQKPFFLTEYGEATLFTLKSSIGTQVSISDFGGVIVSVLTQDKYGSFADIVLGYDNYEGYNSNTYYLGAMIGRCCNRIGKGEFSLNGKKYTLALNDNGKNHLHGGISGFNVKLWKAKIIESEYGKSLRLIYISPDKEEGYPGTLEVMITYSLSEKNELILKYSAHCDADTICSLTNHSYFNLAGHDSGNILGHMLKIGAESYMETDDQLITTGRILPVEGTPLDFRNFHSIGERINDDYEALIYANGYDHNHLLNKAIGEFGFCAEAYEPKSGRRLICMTTSPGVQLYTGNYLDGTQIGKDGFRYVKHGGFCLETQFAPDAIKHTGWESPILKTGHQYEQTTIYRFTTDNE